MYGMSTMNLRTIQAVLKVLLLSLFLYFLSWRWFAVQLVTFLAGAVVTLGAAALGAIWQGRQQQAKDEMDRAYYLNLLAMEFVHNVELARQLYKGFAPALSGQSFTLPDYGFMFTYWETIGPVALRQLTLKQAHRVRAVIYQLHHLARKVDVIINPMYEPQFTKGVLQRYCLMLECADDQSFDEILGYLKPKVEKEIETKIENLPNTPVRRRQPGTPPCP